VSHSTGFDRATRPEPPIPPVPDVASVAARATELVSTDLAQVERLFQRSLASPIEIVGEIGAFVAEGRGKRIRPTLHLLCARLCNYRGPHAVLLGTVLELIHCATLIHDDIIDGASTRRGRPSVNARWGSSITVLFGDYMFAKAMEMALRAESLAVMERLADVTLRMTEGEMLQTRYLGRTDLTREEYLGLIEKKTAALFGCCCELAGLVAGMGDERIAALRRYGVRLGLTFQLIDDLLDLTGEPSQLGKPAASDLREGKLTLSVIDALEAAPAEAARLVAEITSGGPDEAAAVVRLRTLLAEAGALERSRTLAASYAAQAVQELDGFEDGTARRALAALPGLLLSRDR
jgi:octaprenyl-diphosphate synthase